ncbi:MAG: thioredoxin family protein [Bacteroidetes bacterium]|nr:MAG: thioredoxin family protein [Bacteroidota bacterium]
MKTIKILGTGCPKCKATEARVRDVLAELNLEATVEKVEDIEAIMAYDILATPAIVIDERVVHSGLPTVQKVKELLTA